MNTTLLLLSFGTASFGFLVWFALSASLRLPKTFQIQYDINRAYLNRILGRRTLMFIIYFVIPYCLLSSQNLFGSLSPADIGIHFTWNNTATIWVAVLIPAFIILGFVSTKSDDNLTEFPEIRLTHWSTKIFILSTVTWIMLIFSMEFLFRGLILQSLRLSGMSDLMAVIISAGVYGLTQYFKLNRISVFSVPFGLLAGYIVVTTGSLLPAIFIHLTNALVVEWLSVKNHPEIKIV